MIILPPNRRESFTEVDMDYQLHCLIPPRSDIFLLRASNFGLKNCKLLDS